MFTEQKEQIEYIKENYPEITDSRINDNHWDIYCPQCKVVRGFNVTEQQYSSELLNFKVPYIYHFYCPVCRMYKSWIIFVLFEDIEENGKKRGIYRYFRVKSIPEEGLEDIEELPKNPASLRKAYQQAIRAMDANAYIAAAAMFRRALQVITRDIIGVSASNLAKELNDAIGKEYNGAKITKNFADVGYIIKEAGNQGAHPDEDQDLLDFTQQDAEDLQKIFMELVSDLFVAPEAIKKAKEEFLKRRKINK